MMTFTGLGRLIQKAGGYSGKGKRTGAQGHYRYEYDEHVQRDAHPGVKEEVVQSARRAVAAGADPGSIEYMNAGGEGILFRDKSGMVFKVGRSKRAGSLKNESAATQALSRHGLAPRVHRYDEAGDVIVRDHASGSPGAWSQSRGLREVYDRAVTALKEGGFSAPEFKEDSFIVPLNGEVSSAKMVDVGFVGMTGDRLANDLRARDIPASTSDSRSAFDTQLDVSGAFEDGTISYSEAREMVGKIAHLDTRRHGLEILATKAERLGKGGPYLGPRGGKWADPKHTIAWKEGGDTGAVTAAVRADVIKRYKAEGLSKVPPVGATDLQDHGKTAKDMDSGAVLSWRLPGGQKQHAYTNEFVSRNDAHKWDRVRRISKKIPGGQKKLRAVMNDRRKSRRDRDAAAALLAITLTGIRPGHGGQRAVAKSGTKGMMTLQGSDVIADTKTGAVSFSFIGKSKQLNIATAVDAGLARYISASKKGRGGSALWRTNLSGGDMAKAMKTADLTGFKPKDFRTYVGSTTASEFLSEHPGPMTESQVKKVVRKCSELVASVLNNTPAMAKSSYIPPAVFDAWHARVEVVSKALGQDIFRMALAAPQGPLPGMAEPAKGDDDETLEQFPLPDWAIEVAEVVEKASAKLEMLAQDVILDRRSMDDALAQIPMARDQKELIRLITERYKRYRGSARMTSVGKSSSLADVLYSELTKAKYTSRKKGRDGKWVYKYAEDESGKDKKSSDPTHKERAEYHEREVQGIKRMLRSTKHSLLGGKIPKQYLGLGSAKSNALRRELESHRVARDAHSAGREPTKEEIDEAHKDLLKGGEGSRGGKIVTKAKYTSRKKGRDGKWVYKYGEGKPGKDSRGGNVIGRTKSGKPIYTPKRDVHTFGQKVSHGGDVSGYTAEDHQDAADAHQQKYATSDDSSDAKGEGQAHQQMADVHRNEGSRGGYARRSDIIESPTKGDAKAKTETLRTKRADAWTAMMATPAGSSDRRIARAAWQDAKRKHTDAKMTKAKYTSRKMGSGGKWVYTYADAAGDAKGPSKETGNEAGKAHAEGIVKRLKGSYSGKPLGDRYQKLAQLADDKADTARKKGDKGRAAFHESASDVLASAAHGTMFSGRAKKMTKAKYTSRKKKKSGKGWDYKYGEGAPRKDKKPDEINHWRKAVDHGNWAMELDVEVKTKLELDGLGTRSSYAALDKVIESHSQWARYHSGMDDFHAHAALGKVIEAHGNDPKMRVGRKRPSKPQVAEPKPGELEDGKPGGVINRSYEREVEYGDSRESREVTGWRRKSEEKKADQQARDAAKELGDVHNSPVGTKLTVLDKYDEPVALATKTKDGWVDRDGDPLSKERIDETIATNARGGNPPKLLKGSMGSDAKSFQALGDLITKAKYISAKEGLHWLSKGGVNMKSFQALGDLIKAKYTKRTGSPGNYKYEYGQASGRRSGPRGAKDASALIQEYKQITESGQANTKDGKKRQKEIASEFGHERLRDMDKESGGGPGNIPDVVSVVGREFKPKEISGKDLHNALTTTKRDDRESGPRSSSDDGHEPLRGAKVSPLKGESGGVSIQPFGSPFDYDEHSSVSRGRDAIESALRDHYINPDDISIRHTGDDSGTFVVMSNAEDNRRKKRDRAAGYSHDHWGNRGPAVKKAGTEMGKSQSLADVMASALMKGSKPPAGYRPMQHSKKGGYISPDGKNSWYPSGGVGY